MTDYIVNSKHAEVLANGKGVAPGDTVSLDASGQVANATLIDDGILKLKGGIVVEIQPATELNVSNT